MPSQMLYKVFFASAVSFPLLTLKRVLMALFCPLWGVLYCPYDFL